MLENHKVFLIISLLLFTANPNISAKDIIPVKGATINDWNSESFWHYPWGKSVVHHGIDIFAKKGTSV